MNAWVNQTGGLFYHYLAWKYRNNLWRNYRKEVSLFLHSLWENPSHQINQDLLLIGPSGGYTLPTDWLKKFKQIVAIDMDPLAPFFFQRTHRLPKTQIIWIKKNYFIDPRGNWRVDWALKLQTDFKNHLWFFTHLIGQLPLLLKKSFLEDEKNWQKWQSDWKQILDQIHWISFHDLFSVSCSIDPQINLKSKAPDNKNDLLQVLLKNHWQQEVTDHLTHGLLPTTDKQKILVWNMTPQQSHFIEAAAKDFF